MKRLIQTLTLLFTVLIAPALAQTRGGLIFQSSTTGVNYDPLNGIFPLGYNAQATLYPVDRLFSPTASGACPPTTTTCNGLSVRFIHSSIEFYRPLAEITYVSPYQINLVIPSVFLNATQTYIVEVYSGDTNTHSRGIAIPPHSALPIVTYQSVQGSVKPLIIGTLYDNTGTVAIKSLTDGNPNPRTYNGQPTVAQVYFSGWYATDPGAQTPLTLFYDGAFLADVNLYPQYPGVALTNALAPPGGWTAGVKSILLKFVNPDPPQDFGFNAFIWWAE